MRTGALIIAIVVVLIAIFTFVLLSNDSTDVNLDIDQNSTTTEQIATTSNPTTDDNLTDSWVSYSTTGSDVIFSYPDEAEVRNEAGRVVVRYIGPDSEPNTEITDGFTFAVRTEPFTSDSDIEAVAAEILAEESENLSVIASTTEISVGTKTAYEFTLESLLGTPVTYVVFEASDGGAFVVDYFIADPNNEGYDTVIDQILRSLEYEEA